MCIQALYIGIFLDVGVVRAALELNFNFSGAFAQTDYFVREREMSVMSFLDFLLGVYVALIICSIVRQLGLNGLQSCFPLNINLSEIKKRFNQKILLL